MQPSSRALSLSEVRQIIRDHPSLFAALGSQSSTDLHAWSGAAAKLVLANPQIMHAIAATGLGITVEEAARTSFLSCFAAADIFAKTAAENDPAGLIGVIFEEISDLAFPGGVLQ